MKRCKDCRYPLPMHRPDCDAREKALQDIKSEGAKARTAIRLLLRAALSLPKHLQEPLAKDGPFMDALRNARDALNS